MAQSALPTPHATLTPQQLIALALAQRAQQAAAAQQRQGRGATPTPSGIGGAAQPVAGAAGVGTGAYLASNAFGGAPVATAPTEITVGLGGGGGLSTGVTPASYQAWNAGANAATADAASAGAGVPAEAGMFGGYGLPLLGAAGAAYTGYRGYKTYQDLKNGDGSFATGFKESLKPANLPLSIGTLGLWSVGSGLASKFLGGNVDAKKRGLLRRALEGSGFASAGETLPAGSVTDAGGTFVKLADGSYYDIGEKNKGAYNVALDTPVAVGANGALNPLAYILAGGNKKLSQDLSGYLTNAALSGGDAKENIRAFYQAAGLDQAQAHAALDQLVASGAIPDTDIGAYKNGVNQVFDSRRLDQDLPEIAGVTAPGTVSPELANVVNPKGAPAHRVQAPYVPTMQSNGKYRLSPGVYSDRAPSLPMTGGNLSPDQLVALQAMAQKGILK